MYFIFQWGSANEIWMGVGLGRIQSMKGKTFYRKGRKNVGKAE